MSTTLKGVRKKQPSEEEKEIPVKTEKANMMEEVEMTFLKLLNDSMIKLQESLGTEKATEALEVVKTLTQLRSQVILPYKGNSIDIMIKFVSATHLESLQGALDALKSSLMADLLNSPDLMGFDLSEVVIDISVSEDVLLECMNNLYQSELETIINYIFHCLLTFYEYFQGNIANYW